MSWGGIVFCSTHKYRLDFIDTPEDAIFLYEEAQALPTVLTIAKVKEATNIVLSIPYQDRGGLLTAIDSTTLEPKIVKLLINDLKTELDAVTKIINNSPPPSIPQMRIISVEGLPLSESRVAQGHSGEFKGICMPRYTCSLVENPVLSEDVLLRGFQQIKSAVDFIHNLDLIPIIF